MRWIVLAWMLAAGLVLWLGAGRAAAVVVQVGGHKYGVTPIRGVQVQSSPLASRVARSGPRPFDTTGPMLYHGGPVMHSVNNHVIFWDPNKEFTAETKEIVEKFFTDVAHDSGTPGNFLGVGGQYTDGTGRATYAATLAGGKVEVDETAYPATGNCTIPKELGVDEGPYTTCLFDSQVQNALKAFVEAKKLTKGPAQQYFVLTPHKVVTCFNEPSGEICSNNFYCAYHSAIAPGTAGEIIYSDIPFSLLDTEFAKGCQADGHATIQLPNGNAAGGNETTRFADVALKYTSHEYTEAATDPTGGGYYDAEGNENGDKCNVKGFGEGRDPNAFLPVLGGEAAKGTLFDQEINTHRYYLQSEWDNAANACTMRPVPINSAGFAPLAGVAGIPISFNATATDVYGGLTATWKWGDGTESSGISQTHTYASPGTYEVTMTASDPPMFLTSAPVVHTVAVAPVTPPPPPPPVVPLAPTPAVLAVVPPNSGFTPGATAFDQKTGEIALTETIADPGTFSWLVSFPNGKFGVFASSNQKCKPGQVRLGGKCRPSKLVFAKGARVVAAPGAVSFRLKPSASGLKALKNALKQKKALPVTITLTFQSARGGNPVSQTKAMTVKLKKH
jgi:PKD repeat protein